MFKSVKSEKKNKTSYITFTSTVYFETNNNLIKKVSRLLKKHKNKKILFFDAKQKNNYLNKTEQQFNY